MEDEDGTCLLDVLCDPQALNDFLHGTNELPSGDLLINSSSGEPSLFTDTPSPASLLADDASSQDTPVSGCVDLSFLEEALLASPVSSLRSGGPEEAQDPDIHLVEQQKESDEICDILQQSLQEADITEDTLAGLAQTAETLQLGLSDASLPLPATTYFSKPSTGLISLPKDTQTAVEPPQPSLLAVGPGCPSLKPPGTQLMSLLPGNVFPTAPLETSFSINSAQSTSMITQKTLPSLTSCQMLTSSIRAITPSVVMLPKIPLPIQPKLPVNIQPRLVQISPRPSGQKQLSGFAFISATTTQSVLLSPSVGSKQSLQAQSTSVSKPISFNLVGQGSPIVIQPQDPFQGQRQFFLPSQTSTTMTQSTSISRCLLSTPSNQVSNKPNVDSSQILTIQPRQINFSPIFTSPNGQLTLKQGTLPSGSLPIRPTPPTVFQMPTHLAGTYAPQAQGQQDAVGQNTVGNQIRLINNAGMLLPDMTTTPIVNGQSVIQSLLPSQRTLLAVPEGKTSLTQNSVLLLAEKSTEDEEKVNEPLQESRLLPQASPIVEMQFQPSPAPALLQPPPDASRSPEPVLSLAPQLMTHSEEHRFTEGEHNPLHHNEASVHLPQQHYPLKPSAPQEILAATLLVQMDNNISTATGETEDALIPLTASESFSATTEIPLPAHHCSENSDTLLQSPTGQCSVKTTRTDSMNGSMPPISDELASFVSFALGAESKSPEEPVKKLTVPYARNNCGIISLEQHDLQAMVHRHSQDKETYSALQKKTQTECSLQEEKLAKKQHMLKQQLFLDHSAVLSPDTSAQFFSVEDAVRHLLPYHTCARALPGQADCISVDKQFECFSVVLLKRFKEMLNKYRQLLLAESQQESPSAEMVMLERLFLQSERLSLGEDRRRARRDQESFLMSRPKNWQHSQVSAAQTGFSGCPPSPPSWTLQSDRPPGLKTYRSSSRGALRLTIKQESGSRKVIRNSACDASSAISGCKRNHSGQVTKGGAMQGKAESLKPPLPNVEEYKNELNKQKLHPDVETIRTGNESQNHADSVAMSDHIASRVQAALPEQCPPALKRNRLVAESPSLPALVEDGELSEHLQSAIDSILELQRLQGSAAGVKPKIQPLDQAVSSLLEGQL